MRDLDLTTLRLPGGRLRPPNIARAAEQEHIAPRPSASESPARGLAGRRAADPDASRRRPDAGLRGAARAGAHDIVRGGPDRGRDERLRRRSAGPGPPVGITLRDCRTAAGRYRIVHAPACNQGIKINIEEHFTRDIPRVLRDGSNGIGICWDTADLRGLQQRPYRGDDLALAVPARHPLARRKALRFEQTLDYEHVGLQPTSSVQMALERAAARSAGPSITGWSCRPSTRLSGWWPPTLPSA